MDLYTIGSGGTEMNETNIPQDRKHHRHTYPIREIQKNSKCPTRENLTAKKTKWIHHIQRPKSDNQITEDRPKTLLLFKALNLRSTPDDKNTKSQPPRRFGLDAVRSSPGGWVPSGLSEPAGVGSVSNPNPERNSLTHYIHHPLQHATPQCRLRRTLSDSHH